jgi:hypothetical protein
LPRADCCGPPLLRATRTPKQKHRHGELLAPLTAVVEALLSIDAAELDGALLVALVDARARAAEHVLLLHALRPAPETPSDTEEPEAPFRGFRFKESKGYEPLPAARTKTVGVDVKTKVPADVYAPAAEAVTAAAGAIDRALAKCGGAQAQRIVEQSARMATLLGKPTRECARPPACLLAAARRSCARRSPHPTNPTIPPP